MQYFGERNSNWKNARPDCLVCGKTINTYNKGSKFHGKCYFEYRKTHPRLLSEEAKERISQANKGPKNGMWKGNKVSRAAGHARAERLYKRLEPCEICGITKTERHHKDGNTLNNNRPNIQFLCRFHHTEVEGKLERRDRNGQFATV